MQDFDGCPSLAVKNLQICQQPEILLVIPTHSQTTPVNNYYITLFLLNTCLKADSFITFCTPKRGKQTGTCQHNKQACGRVTR
jgi:hypothetical protein